MSECQQACRLNAYHDGEMPAGARAELEQHLRQCPQCTAELERLRAMSRLAAAVPAVEIPPMTLQRLHRRIDLLPSRTIARLAEVVSAIAATILIACVVGLVRQPASNGTAASMAIWETPAQASSPADTTDAASEESLANAIAQDLSGNNGHD